MDEAKTETDPRLTREQQAMVAKAAPRVPQIARSMRHLLGGISFDECESAGYEALARAALRYDPSFGVPFTGFAYRRIRGAMLDAARQVSPNRRRLARAIHLVEAADAASASEAAPAQVGDPRVLAERVAAAAAVVREITAAVVMTRLVSADTERMADGDSPGADEVVADAQTRAHVTAAMGRCEPDERTMLDALYFRGLSMHDYATEIGVNVSTVSRRHSKALRKLAAWFAERPP